MSSDEVQVCCAEGCHCVLATNLQHESRSQLWHCVAACRLECLERLGDEDGIWVWKRINALFNWLPLAALIEGKILCMHGGIGRCINTISQIEQLQRPITMEEGGPVLMDLLWSDPTTNDSVVGVQPSPRGPGLVTFGPDRVKDFCKVSIHGLP